MPGTLARVPGIFLNKRGNLGVVKLVIREEHEDGALVVNVYKF